MASISIPEVHLPGIKLISELPEDQIQKIYAFLKNIKNATGIERFSQNFEEAFKDKSLQPIPQAIFSFGQLMSYPDYDPKVTAFELAESYQELANYPLEEIENKILEERLNNILVNSTFLINTNEAYSIIAEFKSVTRSRISTDVRLLFNESNYTNRNAILFHKLKIRFIENGSPSTDIFYLDSQDLKDLKSQIEESLTNEENIRRSNEGILSFIEFS